MDEFDDDEDDFLLSIPLEEQSTGTNDVFLAFINRILCFTKLDYTARCNLFEKGVGGSECLVDSAGSNTSK